MTVYTAFIGQQYIYRTADIMHFSLSFNFFQNFDVIYFMRVAQKYTCEADFCFHSAFNVFNATVCV